MDVSGIFGTAHKQASWLTAKQSVVAGNIANANTPGFKARQIDAFQMALKDVGMKRTHASHFHAGSVASGMSVSITKSEPDQSLSGNSVNLEKELMQMAEVQRRFSLNAAITKTFQRMYLSAVRAGA